MGFGLNKQLWPFSTRSLSHARIESKAAKSAGKHSGASKAYYFFS